MVSNCEAFHVADLLLNWYQNNARDLPWRGQPDPYAIWVSEIMLQQTRVEAVLPYYQRWMARFPDLPSLAQASQQEVLAAWEGLGYYSRARNLHRAAQVVMAEHGGRLPDTAEALRKLPGIGRYTAGAIASIAFGRDEPALDGNIRRVLARLFNVEEPARSAAGQARLWELAAAHLPPGRAGDYNQALMELGALICTPRRPDCARCPLAGCCQAHALGLEESRPVQSPKPDIPHVLVAAAVIQAGERVLITQRPQAGLLGGLWEFPGGKIEAGEDLVTGLKREISEELDTSIRVGEELGVFEHAYSHFRVTLHAYHCALTNGRPPRPVQVDDMRWVRRSELPDYPMGKIDRQIAKQLMAAAAREA